MLYKLSFLFYKLALELTVEEFTKLLSTLQQIPRYVERLNNDVIGYVKSGVMVPEVRNHATRLRSLLLQLINLVRAQTPDWNAVKNKFQELFGEFVTFRNTYMPKSWVLQNNYEPMKKIEIGLVAAAALLQRQNQPTQLIL